MISCVLYMATFLPAIALQCHPIKMAWLKWDGEQHAKCLSMNAIALAAAAFNMVLDAVVVALPLRELTKLKMSGMRKAGILFMFLGGGLYVFLPFSCPYLPIHSHYTPPLYLNIPY